MFDGENCIRCGKYCKFEELEVLPSSYGVCAECAIKIDPNRGPKRMCPDDGTEMEKELFRDRVLIEKCKLCGGVWLGREDLEIIKDIARKEGAANSAGWVWILAFLSSAIG